MLTETTPALNELGPEFFSCTYGAGGSTRDNTLGIVSAIHEAGIKVAPHLSFGGDDKHAIGELLNRYVDLGIEHLVALHGDMPSGMGGTNLVYANELVEFEPARAHAHHLSEPGPGLASWPPREFMPGQ